ncbi:tRNA (adenosine(37)-N6)-threonylcarbamoyltransferase complex ATPase subunit type 1 TsaE [Candidatus Uhrbacteria bacterium]|nr:tRNA (adenosine(37)-N6)-threonylcarbamoyltransferase complex ATPase subunit type 1 TsaE [Candidatus Uhrbacteria bacterium]
MKYETNSPQQTADIAARFASTLHGGEVVYLEGDLGAGKTTFVRAVAAALGATDAVRSPTFTLVQIYKTTHPVIKQIIHADLYRIDKPVDARELGLQEYAGRTDTILLIEWPKNILPIAHQEIRFEHTGEQTRTITIPS